MAFLQNEAATAYVVEYDSHVGGQRNDATFGEFPSDVYENAWHVKPEHGGHEQRHGAFTDWISSCRKGETLNSGLDIVSL